MALGAFVCIGWTHSSAALQNRQEAIYFIFQLLIIIINISHTFRVNHSLFKKISQSTGKKRKGSINIRIFILLLLCC